MENRILEIVFYLIDLLRENPGGMLDSGMTSADLKTLGYTEEEISQAYSLISRRSEFSGEQLFAKFPQRLDSHRLMTSEERYRLSPEAQSFLLKLSHLGVINHEQLEGILETALNSGISAVDIEEIKHITSDVLMDDSPEGNKFVHFDPDGSERLH